MSSEKKNSRGYVSSTLGCYCPRCREGRLFKNSISARLKKNMEMNKDCPVCGQPTEIEVGFYYGTSYVSYVLSILISVFIVIIWFLVIGLSEINLLVSWMVFNGIVLILLQPWLMRLSRSIWISWFVKYDPDWKEHQPGDVSERLNPDQANNW
jgi:uncharacterized protein (DUF983 family)